MQAQLAREEVNVVNAENNLSLASLNLVQMLNLDTVQNFSIAKPEITMPSEVMLNSTSTQIYESALMRQPEIISEGSDILGLLENGYLLLARNLKTRTGEAVRCYRRAAQLDPDHREANYRLGQLLLQSADAAAAIHLERARMLSEREVILGTLMDTREPAHYAPKIARLEVELRHLRLAQAWFEEAVRLNPYDEELKSEAAGAARRAAQTVDPAETGQH